jgi:hypothetical protein
MQGEPVEFPSSTITTPNSTASGSLVRNTLADAINIHLECTRIDLRREGGGIRRIF